MEHRSSCWSFARPRRPAHVDAGLHVDAWLSLHQRLSAYPQRDRTSECETMMFVYSTVTDFARFRGWSTSHPRRTAMWYASSCKGIAASSGCIHGEAGGREITDSVRVRIASSP